MSSLAEENALYSLTGLEGAEIEEKSQERSSAERNVCGLRSEKKKEIAPP